MSKVELLRLQDTMVVEIKLPPAAYVGNGFISIPLMEAEAWQVQFNIRPVNFKFDYHCIHNMATS